MEYKNNAASRSPSAISPSLRPSFREAMCRAVRQLDQRCFRKEEQERARELQLIMAEVYMMAPDKPIRISGEWLDGYVVQEVFRQLNSTHGRMVIEEFEKLTDQIKNPKAYLRTMLYNSVFSIESHYENANMVDMKESGELEYREEMALRRKIDNIGKRERE